MKDRFPRFLPRMKGVSLLTLMIVALFASTQGYEIHSKYFHSFFGCKGNGTDAETHVAGACFAVNASASVEGYRTWKCGFPCPDGTCLAEPVYDDANCTKMSNLPAGFPNPNYVPTGKCVEQAIRKHFFIHCDGP